MGIEGTSGGPTARRYSPEEKARAVRLVRQLREELGTSHGTVQRVAGRWLWGRVAADSGSSRATSTRVVEPGVTTAEARRIRELEQENRELRRANAPNE